jgi:hypothetical protein
MLRLFDLSLPRQRGNRIGSGHAWKERGLRLPQGRGAEPFEVGSPQTVAGDDLFELLNIMLSRPPHRPAAVILFIFAGSIFGYFAVAKKVIDQRGHLLRGPFRGIPYFKVE